MADRRDVEDGRGAEVAAAQDHHGRTVLAAFAEPGFELALPKIGVAEDEARSGIFGQPHRVVGSDSASGSLRSAIS
ncbi:hypothetical protein JCM2811A_50360 [Methylorubrum rhodinum]